VTYAFNKASQLASLTDWASRVTSYTYVADGSVKDFTDANGTTTTYTDDNARRLVDLVHKLGSTVIDQRTYTLDPVGNVTAVSGGSSAVSTERVSESSTHGQGNGVSQNSYISADGRWVVFQSDATALVSGDTNAVTDAFLRDRLTGVTIRVSVSSSGVQGNGASTDPAISADGRYVTYVSAASNLISGDTNAKNDIFVYDRSTAATTRVSVSSSGAQTTKDSSDPVLSADGQFVAFGSAATNLVSGDTNAAKEISVRDRTAGTTTRVSVSTSGAQGTGDSYDPAVSGDGRYVAFESLAPNLVSGDTNLKSDIFLRDRTNSTTTRLSVSSAGVQGDGDSFEPAIAGNGTKVVFESASTNLVSGDTNAGSDIFVRDVAANTTTRVSVDSAGAQANGASGESAISGDGSHVAFESLATNLVSGDTNSKKDIFVRDLAAGVTTRVSISTTGAQADKASANPVITGDDRSVAFQSEATNLVAGDTNATKDVFVRGPGIDASTYAYDRLYRLTSASEPVTGTTTYTYDPVGNRLTRVRGSTTSYTYDRADRITAAGATSLTVNANGNTTARGTDTFAYDQANRLTSATVAGASETYTYDGDGTRFTRQVGGNPAIGYATDPNRALPVTIDDGSRKYVWGLGLAYAVTGSSLEVYHADRLGSVRDITDGTGRSWQLIAPTSSARRPPREATSLSHSAMPAEMVALPNGCRTAEANHAFQRGAGAGRLRKKRASLA
jgi:YD repeat-containing protein